MTLSPLWSAVIAATVALGGAWLTYLASRRNHRGDVAQKMIDQHQEDIKDLRAERLTDAARIAKLERTQRIQGDYIGQLRKHIADGHPPPPPPWPEGLIS